MPRPDNVGVGTAAIIIKKVSGKHHVLLLKRQGAHWADHWAVPGGWIDREDESTADAVAREVLEETGMVYRRDQISPYCWTTEDNPTISCRTVTLYHTITWNGTEPQIKEPSKCSEMRWFSEDDELPELMFPNSRKVVEELFYVLFMRDNAD